jgi:hypothetical protein
MCAQSVTPKSDGQIQPIELPWLVEIANSLPPHVDAPDWHPRRTSITGVTNALEKAVKQSLARSGIDLEKEEATRFQRFLDETFPRAQFAAFRDLIDGPDLAETAVRKQGLETISVARSSADNYRVVVTIRSTSIENYRFVVTTRRTLRDLAELGSQMAARARRKRLLYPLRICAFCQKLFIARRNNNKYCPTKCGAAFRQARKRNNDRQGDYEAERQRKMAEKELERKLNKRKLNKGA